MPIYEYQCTACGHQLEALQKMSDEPLKDCPDCKQPALSKLVSAAGFQLKGSGWYVTDYSNKGKSMQQAANSENAAANSASSITEKKSTDSSSTKQTSTNTTTPKTEKKTEPSSSSSSTQGSGAAST